MKKFLTLILISSMFTSTAFATTGKKYIKNSKGQTTGYTRSYSNGTIKQYKKNGNLEYTYKKSSNGTITKYSKTGRKLESYK